MWINQIIQFFFYHDSLWFVYVYKNRQTIWDKSSRVKNICRGSYLRGELKGKEINELNNVTY